ncbi:hypothetical protein [Blastococcus xanthinilyticus]|uniref:hypothetical protein n=1 Tax=Blastococcus xanthinilyticus TaxID=1564164 RepID=UPI0014125EF5|nr:hypothetical protein [Blastococcus xanthinilyticus]
MQRRATDSPARERRGGDAVDPALVVAAAVAYTVSARATAAREVQTNAPLELAAP